MIVAGKGTIGQYGLLEWCAGYVPVVRGRGRGARSGGRARARRVDGRRCLVCARASGPDRGSRGGRGDILSEYDDLASGVAALLSDRGAASGRIGVAGLRHLLSAWEASRLAEALPHAELVDVTTVVSGLKAVKDALDIEQLEATAAIADAGFEALLAELAPGPDRLGAERRDRAVDPGAGRPRLARSSSAPERTSWSARPRSRSATATSSRPTSRSSGRPATGSSSARLVAVGEIDDERSRLAESCLDAARAAETELVVGRSAGDVATAIDAAAARSGLRIGIWHGHGVGVDHDPPVITAGDTTPLAEGMVISVHPNLSTADERLGASVADTYVIEAAGPRRLSHLAAGLIRSS